MSDIELVGRYLESWNIDDAAARRAVIDEVWAEGGVYTDPLGVAEGRDAIDATIGGARGQFPGLEFRLAGDVDAHHDVARFGWELGPACGEALVVGFDVAVLDADGRIARVYGFLDRVRAGA